MANTVLLDVEIDDENSHSFRREKTMTIREVLDKAQVRQGWGVMG